jgi:hypothetical protein
MKGKTEAEARAELTKEGITGARQDALVGHKVMSAFQSEFLC